MNAVFFPRRTTFLPPRRVGIYALTDIGRKNVAYVGQSHNLTARESTYRGRRNLHNYMLRSWVFRPEGFDFVVLIEDLGHRSRKYIDAAESELIAILSPPLNIQRGARCVVNRHLAGTVDSIVLPALATLFNEFA